jgi:methyltransferase (TIGR00027 family)
MPIRVAAIDQEIAAVAPDAKQVVILGAGLDTRAWRLQSLRDLAVFEVDHPATQAYKEQRARSLRRVSKSVTFVPVDFERDSLAACLRASGFVPENPTIWVWEGVVMYLTNEAVRRTLGDIASCSTSGSTLLIHYHSLSQEPADLKHRFSAVLLSFLREPQVGDRPVEVMQGMVKEAGFDVVRDTGPADWAVRLGSRPPIGQTAALTHLLVARRV